MKNTRSVLLFRAFALSLFLFGSVATLAAPAASRTEKLRAKLESNDRNYVFVIMHRGDWRNAPENSVAAILGSIQKGADIVELDVRKTKDGEYVLVHDATIDRVSNGKGKVKDLTLAQLRQFRLLASDGKTLTDYRFLTLKEAFALTRGKILVNLDKFPVDPKGVISFVKEQGMEREVVLKGSFAPNALKQKITDDFHAVETGKLCYMPILQINQPRALQEFEAWQKLQRQPFAYELCFSRETPCDVLLALQKLQGSNGPRIWINTLWDSLCAGHTDERGHKGDPEGSWGWCLRQGATMIQTDRPVELIAYLKGKGRRNL